jgi:hypothetical protein
VDRARTDEDRVGVVDHVVPDDTTIHLRGINSLTPAVVDRVVLKHPVGDQPTVAITRVTPAPRDPQA